MLSATTQQYTETCQYCGECTGLLKELEPTQEWKCGECDQCMVGNEKPENCVSCDSEPQYIEHVGPFDLASADHQLATGVCSKCEQNLYEHTREVQAGGIWFKCACGANGVVKADHPVAQAVRLAAGVKPPEPCALEVDDCAECSSGEEKKTTKDDDDPTGG